MSFTPVQVTQLVQNAILTRLSDATYGLSAAYNVLSLNSAYTLPSEASATGTINWTVSGPNVAFGRLGAIQLLNRTSNYAYPFVFIDVVSGSAKFGNERYSVKSARYSGPMRATIQVVLSWEAQQVTDFASWPNCVTDCLIACFNDWTNAYYWAPGIVYAGELSFSKSPAAEGGDGWVSVVECNFALDVEIQ